MPMKPTHSSTPTTPVRGAPLSSSSMQHWHAVLELIMSRAPRAEKVACDLAAADRDGWDEMCWLEENRYMLEVLFATHKFVPGVPPAHASREVYAANVSRRGQVGTRSYRRPATIDRQYTYLYVVYNRSRPRRRRYPAPVPATACRRARARAAKSRIRSTLPMRFGCCTA